MEGGVLEVFLVSAKGLGRYSLLGSPYHVKIACGSLQHKSKASSGKNGKTAWNEKFTLKFPLSDWENLSHVKFRIIKKGFLTGNGCVGEALVHIGGILSEGLQRGSIEVKPAPYNVVLEDDTYRGQIKIGFKFTVVKEMNIEERATQSIQHEKKSTRRRRNPLRKLWKIFW